jgi:16S rRNA (guanine1516-N2)-methyltransferase
MKIALEFNNQLDPEYQQLLQQITALPVIDSADGNEHFTHCLSLDESGLSLRRLELTAGETHQQPTRIDFTDAALHYRLGNSGKQQGLAKAVGLNKHSPMHVLDATAGLGRDAFILASMGCQVTMLEQSLVIYSLLADGLKRAEVIEDTELQQTIRNMSLHQVKAQDWFTEITQGQQIRPDVIYLDPMFPPRNKTANVKKDIALLQEILGFEEDSSELIALACDCAKHRVVVKRPGKKPDKKASSDGLKPSFVVPGKTAHFEVFI